MMDRDPLVRVGKHLPKVRSQADEGWLAIGVAGDHTPGLEVDGDEMLAAVAPAPYDDLLASSEGEPIENRTISTWAILIADFSESGRGAAACGRLLHPIR